jgi:hypothetical protein
MLGAVAVDVDQVFVGDPAQLSAEFAGDFRGVELGMIAHDRVDGVDMMRDQFRRHPVEIGRVLDDPAQAFGGDGGGGVAEGGGIALDVVGGASLRIAA